MSERPLPPVTQLAMVSLGLIVAGGIYLSAHLPQHVPLGPAVALLATSAAVLAVNVFLLSRVRDFNWSRFFQVGKWSLLAYVAIAGMILYVFLRNHVSGGSLVVLTLSLVVFAVHVPMLVGFTVARYADREDRVAA
jgi:membrane protein YdbS with pleckstrin-like domain